MGTTGKRISSPTDPTQWRGRGSVSPVLLRVKQLLRNTSQLGLGYWGGLAALWGSEELWPVPGRPLCAHAPSAETGRSATTAQLLCAQGRPLMRGLRQECPAVFKLASAVRCSCTAFLLFPRKFWVLWIPSDKLLSPGTVQQQITSRLAPVSGCAGARCAFWTPNETASTINHPSRSPRIPLL